mmetsp:Transcript_12674/g.20416  ORF Transcript_12674/g.20416 Transcript_12674/m.20416 type:complete len:219 (+) Transcript_12674:46-702(+)
MTAPTDAQWSAMAKVVDTIYKRPDAEPFRVPVDWKAMGLFDYPRIIKKPMDLGTVKKKIADRTYKSIPEAADDVRLVWTNCMTYNADGSDFFLLAKSLSKRFEEKYNKLAADMQIDASRSAASTGLDAAAVGSAGMISLDEKRAFARSLYKISKEELGKVIVEVDSQCPAALVKNMAEDEAELNVDKIPPVLFRELKVFVDACSKAAATTKKAAKKKS